jgi:3-hydroxyisobutyrate dehydrogenase-like beta-hydroxyacid dehydrogenase
MGSAVAARLAHHGARVVTSLKGRSASSAERAQAAGMVAVDDQELVEADFLLSIVPPKEALPIAVRLAPALKAASRKPVYIDCNAVSPETAMAIGKALQDTGTHFLDGSIIGMPPKVEGNGPTFYVSGPEARAALGLEGSGLTIKALDAPIGAASALKMSYGGITKGLVALGSVMSLAADRYGVGGELGSELAASQPQLLAWFSRMVPNMFPKAYRWVAEMDEISAYLGDRPESDVFNGIARVYEDFAADWDAARSQTGVLEDMFRSKTE